MIENIESCQRHKVRSTGDGTRWTKFFKEDLVLSNAEDSGSARAPDLTSQSRLAGETFGFMAGAVDQTCSFPEWRWLKHHYETMQHSNHPLQRTVNVPILHPAGSPSVIHKILCSFTQQSCAPIPRHVHPLVQWDFVALAVSLPHIIVTLGSLCHQRSQRESHVVHWTTHMQCDSHGECSAG